jgi:3-methyladenine DNA glycosylase/8-oxoguanine DNA glycosylase/superfamily II DNA or RNA helicase
MKEEYTEKEEYTKKELRKDDDDESVSEHEIKRGDSDEEYFEDDSSDSEMDVEQVVPVTPVKKKSNTTQSSVVTPSPRKRKTKDPPSIPTSTVLSGKSIALRGLPRGALAKHRTTGLTIRALESVPPLKSCSDRESADRRELFCRFLIVSVGTDKSTPEDLVGKTFESATEFHQALADGEKTRDLVVTYDMEVSVDPPFAPWNFVQDRLLSAGLVLADDIEAGDEQCGPFVVTIDWDGNSKLSRDISWYRDFLQDNKSQSDDSLVWALIESDQSELPAILVGAPKDLVGEADAPISQVHMEFEEEGVVSTRDTDLLPPLSLKTSKVALPASLLQIAIRRGSMLCSSQPLLEACSKLLLARLKPIAGSTLAMLKAVWGCMLVDASPFDDSEGCLGLPGLLLLSLIARANPGWSLPPPLRRAAVLSALRTASIVDTQPWIGYVRRDDNWWKLEEGEGSPDSVDLKALNLRNLIRVSQAGVGGRLSWGKWNKFIGDTSTGAALAYLNGDEWRGSYLMSSPSGDTDHVHRVQVWERGGALNTQLCDRTLKLDFECRLAAMNPTISPQSLLLLQALLPQPPTSWKKHSLQSLSRLVRKLISEANPRIRERIQLARLATWGKDQENEAAKALENLKELRTRSMGDSTYKSYKEIVTPTGTLSDQELELIECFEAVQKLDYNHHDRMKSTAQETNEQISLGGFPKLRRIKAGPALTDFQGRVAFLLAFGSAVELEIVPDPDKPLEKETISAMFCGDADEPLLVQRIGKARREGKELATTSGATSGAAAVPSLGYVQKERSTEECRIMDAAQIAVANHWKGGLASQLPLLPAGMQWEIPDDGGVILRQAKLADVGNGRASWTFSIAGVKVDLFDARQVVSPCALSLEDKTHRPVPLGSVPQRRSLLVAALCYSKESDSPSKRKVLAGKVVLEAMTKLHDLAVSDRETPLNGLSEGIVYDWLPLASEGPIPSRTWRDALLAIRTRDTEHVVLGQGISSDGSGAPRDMTEGVLLRIFYALEMLYPTAIRKEGATKFLVRPKGAAYHHMLLCLEKLGRSEAPMISVGAKSTKRRPTGSKQRSCKQPRRSAEAASDSVRRQLAVEWSDEVDSGYDSYEEVSSSDDEDGIEALPSPTITTPLWPHQEASVSKVVEGVQKGKRGHADASAVGAGKTLTALATVVRLAHWMDVSNQPRNGVLIMLPNKALIREWLLEIATHTKGFHVIEQREDGTLFSLTYAKSHPPIDANAIIISTLDRVCRHPFVRQTAWDFVVVDECLSVQNASAKRNPSAWRQIEISNCGVLMLSATFFRSKYDQLFYMIRMLRSPLPPSLPWLPATIHEHIVCQVPETDRSWTMKGELVSLTAKDLQKYKTIVEAFKRKQINRAGEADGRKLWVDLEGFLRGAYEGRASKTTHRQSSVMSDAFARIAKSLLRKGRKPLIFADTSLEADFLMRAFRANGIDACTWANVTSQDRLSSFKSKDSASKNRVIVAVKTVEGQGINMQRHADTIICRPTPGDHLEQMKGRVDRPGQTTKDLLLVVVVAEHTIEEAKFANIRLAGNFFREYIAPVAAKYRERIDLEAVLSVAGTKILKRGTVLGTWVRSVEAAGQSGAFSSRDDDTIATSTTVATSRSESMELDDDHDASHYDKKPAAKKKAATIPKHQTLNKVIRNKGDPQAVLQAKARAKQGHASCVVRNWLFPPKTIKLSVAKRSAGGSKPLPKESLLRFSDSKPPLVLDRETIHQAVTHLSNQDPKLAALIARVGVDALANDCGASRTPTQARLFDRCIRAITFTMVSVDAGNAFMRRLAIKVGVCLENKPKAIRTKLLKAFFAEVTESGDKYNIRDPDHLLQLLLDGYHQSLTFTHGMLRHLINDCEPTGHPHLCGPSHPCGKNDDHSIFVQKSRDAYFSKDSEPVSAGFSMPKASFLISMVRDFESGKISGDKIAKASDRQAAKMLMGLKGIGDWCVGVVLMRFLSRADIMLYGDLTIRNYLNDLYDINHHVESETLLESAADFADNAPNRNMMDEVAKKNGWAPYRSVVCLLMYHLQEENLVLL